MSQWARSGTVWKLAAALALLTALLLAACGGGGEAPAPEGSPAASESYAEGDLTIGAEMLDTGLLKGNATVEATEGWRVTSMSVKATAPGGSNWGVIQFPKGVSSASASDFFEVQLGELPRGDQLELTLTVTLESEGGDKVERQATDRWPP